MKKTLRILAVAMVAVVLCLALVSCGGPNADPDAALDALKENDYKATKDDLIAPGVLKLLDIDDVDCVVSGSAEIDDEYETVTIIYFDNAEDAEAEWEDALDYAEDQQDLADIADDNWVCKKSGNMIYFGTKNGVKAAK